MTSEQLKLELGMPWDGYTTRGLTKCARIFTFQAGHGPAEPVNELSGAEAVQLELFPEGTHYGS